MLRARGVASIGGEYSICGDADSGRARTPSIRDAGFFLNTSMTQSMDKVVLEADSLVASFP
jgi:hypothetical protein